MKNPSTISSGESDEREPAPANNLPDYGECERLVENSAFRARAAAGLEGAVLTTLGQSPEPTELHRFIHEYDDADRYRSAWFLHRLEKVVNEAAALTSPAPSVGEPVDIIALAEGCGAQSERIIDEHGVTITTEILFTKIQLADLIREAITLAAGGATPPAAPAATEAPSEQEEKLWGEFLADLEQIRPIGKRHAGMLKAVKKYRLLGEG